MTNETPEQVDAPEVGDVAALGLRSGASRMMRSWRTAGIAIPFLILFVALSISSQPFLHTTNLINILDQQAATLCIAAAGTLVLVAGGIDLSVGATYGLATVVAGEIAAHHSPVLAIVAAIATGLLVGLVNGLIVTVFKINALICTLAMSFVIGGLALKVSGGNLIVLTANSGFYKFANAQLSRYPSAVWMRSSSSLSWVCCCRALPSAATSWLRRERRSGATGRRTGEPNPRHHVHAERRRGGPRRGHRHLATAERAGGSGGSGLAFTVLAGIVVGGTSIAGGEGSVWRTGIGVLFIALDL